jgi:hypothetical protein
MNKNILAALMALFVLFVGRKKLRFLGPKNSLNF